MKKTLEQIHEYFIPDYMNEIKINNKYKEQIINSIPKNFNKLEKAFFVYYLLCKTLTYDEEQYLAKRKYYNDYSIDHSNIYRIENINEKNNRIVCFEFIAIYAKILEELKIKYSIIGDNIYAHGHVSIKLYIDNLEIFVDSTDSILNSDMALAKNALRLETFKLSNSYECSLKEIKDFQNTINNVYKYIESKENKQHLNSTERYKQYKIILLKCKNLNDEEKLKQFFNQINKCTLSTMDSLNYFYNLSKILFGKKLEMYYIKNNKPNDKELSVSVTIVFVYNPINTEDSFTNRYFICDKLSEIKEVNLYELREFFKNKKYEYKHSNENKIPGIYKSLKLS